MHNTEEPSLVMGGFAQASITCSAFPFILQPLLFIMYLVVTGVACRPATYGFPNIVALVQSLGELVTLRGRGVKRILVLNQGFVPAPPFSSAVATRYVL